jgi:hypothetical protein
LIGEVVNPLAEEAMRTAATARLENFMVYGEGVVLNRLRREKVDRIAIFIEDATCEMRVGCVAC